MLNLNNLQKKVHLSLRIKTSIVFILLFFLSIIPLILVRQNSKVNIFPGDKFDKTDFEKNRKLKIGDRTYYLHGALSIFDFEIEKKFNNKHMPIMAQTKYVKKNSMPSYAKYFLFFYPYPSFKFGYSLMSALITSFFSKGFIKNHIDRLQLANFIFVFLSSVLIYYLGRRVSQSDILAIIPCLFFLFDVSNTSNAYMYQSHTMSGIFLILTAVFISEITWISKHKKVFLIAFLLCFALVSSSHTITIGTLYGIIFFLSSFFKINTIKEKFKYTFSAFLGFLITPSYILFCEIFFKFKELGLPRMIDQLMNYSNTVNSLISAYPLFSRFMWRIEIFNVLAYLYIVLSILLVYKLKKKGTLGWYLSENVFIKHLFLALVLSNIVAIFYTQPLSRAMAPFTVFYGFFAGILFTVYLKNHFKLNVYSVAVILLIIFLPYNYLLLFKKIDLFFLEKAPDGRIFTLNESDIVGRKRDYFHKYLKISKEPYRYISKDIETFYLENKDALNSNGDSSKVYIKFSGSLFVELYASTRRFYPQFLPDPKSMLINKSTIEKDFYLLLDILQTIDRSSLKRDEIIISRLEIPNFINWDQENNYIMGYLNGIKTFMGNSKLCYFDPRYDYYISLKNLIKLIKIKTEFKSLALGK